MLQPKKRCKSLAWSQSELSKADDSRRSTSRIGECDVVIVLVADAVSRSWTCQCSCSRGSTSQLVTPWMDFRASALPYRDVAICVFTVLLDTGDLRRDYGCGSLNPLVLSASDVGYSGSGKAAKWCCLHEDSDALRNPQESQQEIARIL